MEKTFHTIIDEINRCTSCRLSETRQKAVVPEGTFPSKFMFIAQAPGRAEDKEGEMLIGPSGKVFNTLLTTVGLKRNEIYLTNLLKCFLPKCRKPRQDEMKTCYENFLQYEIQFVKPEIIVALGFHVTRFLFKLYGFPVPNKNEIKDIFGHLYYAKKQKILLLKHPATVVHKSSTLENLKKEYQILKTLQNKCPNITECFKYKDYLNGLTVQSFVELNCFGNWEKCTYYKTKPGE